MMGHGRLCVDPITNKVQTLAPLANMLGERPTSNLPVAAGKRQVSG